jgi:RNA polymerase sigma factor (sigma-70 family)
MDSLPPPNSTVPSSDASQLRLVGGLKAETSPEGPADVSLGVLLMAMRSSDERERDAAWESVYKRCWDLVWTRVFYVMRTISWAGEPRELATDVASDVFVGLPDAVHHYHDEGKAEQWLKQIAVRTALRKKESLTGKWSSGRSGGDDGGASRDDRGRTYVPFDESADQIVSRLESIEPEEIMELERRRTALRTSDDPTRRRWDEFIQLYIDGFGFAEIGERLGITEASARNWLCKIRKHLAQPIEATS